MSAALLVSLAAPAEAIVGGTTATAIKAGEGTFEYVNPHNGYQHWATCTAHALGSDENGQTDLLITAAQCVTVMPGQQPQAKSAADTARFAALRHTAVRPGSGTAAPDLARSALEGSASTPEDPASFRYVYGSTNRFTGKSVGIKKWIIPKDWNWGVPDAQGRIWDIALVQLQHPIKIRGAVVAPLWPGEITELGWGHTDPRPETWTGPLGPWLHQTAVHTVSRSQCAAGGIGTNEACLGVAANGGGTCKGDAGGGGVRRWGTQWVLTAIASRGIENHCGTANIYTEIWPYGRWIIHQIHDLEPQLRVEATRAGTTQTDFALAG
ncbi:trypsin-like serine protease [Amycolatopsis sp. VC5-11]|uniref:trypsin-like serine protease n=1 Tax=Amycolatopsis sp. VC5-11 TaxID=3120156 RepID=UPI00300A77A1